MDRLQQRHRGFDRADAGAADSRIDVDDDLERPLANRGRERGDVRRIVDSDHEIGDSAVERDEPLDRRRRHDRRGDQDRLDAAGREHLCFAELRAAQADRAGIQLHARDREALVCLGVRPQRHAGALRQRSHLLHVAAERIAIEHEHRRVQLAARSRLADQMGVQTDVVEHELPAIQLPIPKSSTRCALANFAAGSTCARTLQKRSAIG